MGVLKSAGTTLVSRIAEVFLALSGLLEKVSSMPCVFLDVSVLGDTSKTFLGFMEIISDIFKTVTLETLTDGGWGLFSTTSLLLTSFILFFFNILEFLPIFAAFRPLMAILSLLTLGSSSRILSFLTVSAEGGDRGLIVTKGVLGDIGSLILIEGIFGEMFFSTFKSLGMVDSFILIAGSSGDMCTFFSMCEFLEIGCCFLI